MALNLIVLSLTTIAFYTVGGIIDYWQSARHHNKPIPNFLKDYFALFWIILYSGILPFLLVYSASNFDLNVTKIFIGCLLIGMSIWDMSFSLLQSKKFISDIKDYWFWGKKDYPLTKIQLTIWHIIRTTTGLLLLL